MKATALLHRLCAHEHPLNEMHAENLPQILTHLLLLMYQIIFARTCIVCQAIERC